MPSMAIVYTFALLTAPLSAATLCTPALFVQRGGSAIEASACNTSAGKLFACSSCDAARRGSCVLHVDDSQTQHITVVLAQTVSSLLASSGGHSSLRVQLATPRDALDFTLDLESLRHLSRPELNLPYRGAGEYVVAASLGDDASCADAASFAFRVDTQCAARIGVRLDSGCRNDAKIPLQHAPMCSEMWTSLPSLATWLSTYSSLRGMLGVSYDKNAFGLGDHALFQFMLAKHPNMLQLVEFGTFTGITSLFLGMVARIRGGHFTTFDIADRRTPQTLRAWLGDDMTFALADLEDAARLDPRAVAAASDADLLFVDGGDKLVEALLYASAMKLGALLVLHDFFDQRTTLLANAFATEEVAPFCASIEAMGFRSVYSDVAGVLHSSARVWKRAAWPRAAAAAYRGGACRSIHFNLSACRPGSLFLRIAPRVVGFNASTKRVAIVIDPDIVFAQTLDIERFTRACPRAELCFSGDVRANPNDAAALTRTSLSSAACSPLDFSGGAAVSDAPMLSVGGASGFVYQVKAFIKCSPEDDGAPCPNLEACASAVPELDVSSAQMKLRASTPWQAGPASASATATAAEPLAAAVKNKLQRTCTVACVMGSTLRSVMPAALPAARSFLFVNDRTMRGEGERKGWTVIVDPTLPLHESARISTLQAKRTKFVQFLHRGEGSGGVPADHACDFFAYVDHKIRLRSDHIAKLLTHLEPHNDVVLRSTPHHAPRDVRDLLSTLIIQSDGRYRSELRNLSHFIETQAAAGYLTSTNDRLAATGLILWRNTAAAREIADDVYAHIASTKLTHCQIVWAVIAPSYGERVKVVCFDQLVAPTVRTVTGATPNDRVHVDESALAFSCS